MGWAARLNGKAQAIARGEMAKRADKPIRVTRTRLGSAVDPETKNDIRRRKRLARLGRTA